jgi:peptidoglycan/LPS O-acetylase OafA/YrhL
MHGNAAPWPAHLALDNNGFNTIMYGAALALAMRDREWAPRLRAVGQHAGTLVAGVGVLVTIYALNTHWPRDFAIALSPLRNCAVLAIIWWCVNHQKHWVGQLLQARPLVYVGNISFSLYLWQQLFLGHNRGWVCDFPQNLLFAFTVGLVSYHVFEVPMHGLSSRLRQRNPRAVTPVPARDPRQLVGEPVAASPYVEPAEAMRS